MDNPLPAWMNGLDERQQKELEFARLYASMFHHGTDGHSRLMLIAALAERLEQAEILLAAVNAYRMAHSESEASGHATATLNDTYVAMLVAADAFNPKVAK